MKRFHRSIRVLCVLLLLTADSWARDIPIDLRAAVDVAVAAVKPSLVRIHVVSASYRDGREFKYESSGSGVIITPEGHVITNHHVAGHATRLFCTLSNKEEIEAELVGTDALTDIAIIKLLPPAPQTFPAVQFGDSASVTVGDHVLAMGSPLSLSQSVTFGIVSNTDMIMPRRLGFGSFEQDGEDVGSLVKWIGHDAAIFPGNSGGPLVNLTGEIVGINEIGVGLGGAIPGNLARHVAESLIEDGEVTRAWLGIGVQPLLKHSGRESGVLISGAIADSPAHEAGFQPGDILTRLAGREVTVRFDEELPAFNALVAGLTIGEPVDAVVVRDGKELKLSATPAEREERLPKEREFKRWGITGRDLSRIMAKELKRESTDGIYITTIGAGGPAADANPPLSRGDIITKVEGRPVKDVKELAAITEELTRESEKPVPVLTTFQRKAGEYVAVVEVGVTELRDPGLEVKKAWLPVETQVLTRDIAEHLNDEDLRGFRVTQVYSNSTAEEAGLQEGDIITAVDGGPLTASAPEDYEELPSLVRNYRAGTTVELSVIREGKQSKIPVELVRAPMLVREMRKYQNEKFEFTARNVSFFDRAQERWNEEQQGVLVQEIKSGGWAALGGLRVGDLIQAVNDEATADIDTLREIMEKVEEQEADAVVIKVLRGIYTLFLELEPKWDDE